MFVEWQRAEANLHLTNEGQASGISAFRGSANDISISILDI